MIIFLLLMFISSSVLAGEWNEKPVMCANGEEIYEVIKSRNEELSYMATQFTKVHDTDGLSDIPAYLSLRIYTNEKTGSYSIIEHHPSYSSYCVVSYGLEFKKVSSF